MTARTFNRSCMHIHLVAATALFIGSCGILEPDDDNQGITEISTCTISGTVQYADTATTYKFTCSRTYVTGTVTFGPNTKIIITGVFDISGQLTIQQGAHVSFNEGASLWVNGGTLVVSGTAANRVVLDNGTAGTFWGYADPLMGAVYISSDANAMTSIDYCVIDSATNGIASEKDGISITNTTVTYAKRHGMLFMGSGPKDSAAFSGNAFDGCGQTASDFPLVIDVAYLGRLSGNLTFTQNARQAIKVEGGSRADEVNETGLWQKQSVPYIFSGEPSYLFNPNGVTVTIEPGATLLFEKDAPLFIEDATFIANGSAAAPITFGPASSGDYWGSFDSYYGGVNLLEDASANCSFQYCIIDSATNGLVVEADHATVANCTVKNAQSNGIVFYDCGPKAGTFSGNTMQNCGATTSDFPLVIYAPYLTRLTGNGTFTGNSQQAIKVYCEGSSNYVMVSGTWKKHSVPYVFAEGGAGIDNESGVTITIEPGCVLMFQQDAYLFVNTGTLIARGGSGAADSIWLKNAVTGQPWGGEGGIEFESTANPSSVVEYCSIANATMDGIYIDDVPVTVANCTITGSGECGIYSYRSGNTNVNDATITYSGNAGGTHCHEE